jgi:hypothetical protein
VGREYILHSCWQPGLLLLLLGRCLRGGAHRMNIGHFWLLLLLCGEWYCSSRLVGGLVGT